MKAGQALVMIEDSYFVTAQMIQRQVKPVLAHRVLPRDGNDNLDTVLQEILKIIPVPAMPMHLKSSVSHPVGPTPTEPNRHQNDRNVLFQHRHLAAMAGKVKALVQFSSCALGFDPGVLFLPGTGGWLYCMACLPCWRRSFWFLA
jgi:hypothetical protein